MLDSLVLSKNPLLLDAPLALLIFLLSGAIGVRVLRRFPLAGISQIERGLFAFTLGLGIVSYLPFALFALHIGKPVVVAGMFLLLSVLFAKEQFRIVRYLIEQARNIGQLPAPTKIFGAVFLPLLLVTFLQALCPPTDPDGLHYHLTAPQFYLREGGFFYAPTFLHLNWPLGIEMLFAIGMAFHTHFAAGLIQFGIGLILLTTIYQLCLRLVPSEKGSMVPATFGSVAVALSFPFLRGEMTWAYIDLGMGLYITLAGYALHIAWQHIQNGDDKTQITPLWTLAALFAGLSTTAKLPGVFVIILVALLIWGQSRAAETSGSFMASLRPAFAGVLIGVLVAAPWFIRSWVQSGTPVYPYFGKILSVKDASPEFQQRLNEYLQYFVTLPSKQLTPKQVIQLRGMSCAFLAAFATGVGLLRSTRPIRPLILFCCGLTFVQIATSGIYLRYFLPYVPLILVITLWSVRRLFTIKPLSITLFGVSILYPWGLHRLPQTIKAEVSQMSEAGKVIFQAKSRDDYLAERLPGYPIARWCNANLPKDAIITLGIYDAHAALYERRTLSTQYWLQDAIRYHSLQETRADLKRLRATHLIMSEQHLNPPISKQGSKESSLREQYEFALLKRISQENGLPIHHEPGYTVFSLQLP